MERLLEPIAAAQESERDSSPLLERLGTYQIEVREPTEVMAYLQDHHPLDTLVPKICCKVREAFGPAPELALEVYKDPEDGDRYLTLYVRPHQFDSQILRRIDAVTSQFDDQLEQAPGFFLVTTDFRPPRGEHGV